jgi:hypothetical protein
MDSLLSLVTRAMQFEVVRLYMWHLRQRSGHHQKMASYIKDFFSNDNQATSKILQKNHFRRAYVPVECLKRYAFRTGGFYEKMPIRLNFVSRQI